MSQNEKLMRNVEKILKQEILWAVKKGPGFDPQSGALVKRDKFVPLDCGVCAIGAFAVHQNPPTKDLNSFFHGEDVMATAAALGVSPDWLYTNIYMAVLDEINDDNVIDTTIGNRLRLYAVAVHKKIKGRYPKWLTDHEKSLIKSGKVPLERV